MRELSTQEINKVLESKKGIVNNIGLIKYLGGNNILYEKLILSNPITSTFIQLQNLDGTLDILSQSVKVRNISISGLGVSNNFRINNDFNVKGMSTLENVTINKNAIFLENSYFKNVNISDDLIINKLIISGNSNINIDEIESKNNILNIGSNDTCKIINIGNDGTIVNIKGSLNYKKVENDIIQNKELIINGISGNPEYIPVNDIGVFFSDGLDNKKGYIKTDSIYGNTFEFKAPNTEYTVRIPQLKDHSSFLVKNDNTDKVFLENLVIKGDTNLNYLIVNNNATFSNVYMNNLDIYGNLSINNVFSSNESGIHITGNLNLDSITSNIVNANILNGYSCHLIDCIGQSGSFDNFNIKNSTIENSNINYTKIQNAIIKTSDIESSNIKKLNVVHLLVEDDIVLNNSFTRGNSKVYGNQSILGSIDAENIDTKNINIKNNSKTNILTSNNIYSNSINTNNIQSFTMNSKNINIEKSAKINENLYVLNDVFVSNNIEVENDVTIKNKTKLNNVEIKGDLKLCSLNIEKTLDSNSISTNNLNVSGNSCMYNSLIQNDMNVLGNLTIREKTHGSQFLGDYLKINNEAICNSMEINECKINKDLFVEGNVSSNNLTVHGSNYIDKNLIVNKNTIINGNLDVSGYTNISSLCVNNGLQINGSVFINNEEIITKQYINSIQTTFTYLILDGLTYTNNYSFKNGLYTYIINGNMLNKTSKFTESIKNTIYCIEIDNNNNLYVGGMLNENNRVICKFVNNKWIDLDYVKGTIVDIIRVDNRGIVYIGGDFGDLGKLLQYNPKTNTWNNIGSEINGSIKTLEFDSKNNVYIGGNFSKIGNISMNNISKWDVLEHNWYPLKNGLNNIVNAISIDIDDNVYVGGDFTNYILKWNNEKKDWETLHLNLDRNVTCLGIDNINNLYICGRFTGIVIRYNLETKQLDSLRNGLIGDVKCLAIDSNNSVYISMNTAPYLFRLSNNKWVHCVKNINGQITSLKFDKNDKLYVSGYFSLPYDKIFLLESDYTKTISFNNLIKYVNDEKKLVTTNTITFCNIADTITIKFENRIGYVIYKSNGVCL